MKVSLRKICAGAAITALLCAPAVLAQAGQEAPPPPPDALFFYQKTGPGPLLAGGGIGLVRFEGLVDEKVVTGEPFTATITQQSSQTLSDGNRIVRKATGTFARDGQGRTRRDLSLPAIGPWSASGENTPHAIFINDPVAGTRYILDPNRKIAHEVPSHPLPDVREKRKLDPGPSAQVEQQSTTVSLGTQTINGVTAQGTRTVRTIPAGEIGNEKPITITVEKWYSPELQAVVLLKHSDPMMGDSVYQLTDIQRTEPDASLFQVPAGYTIRQRPDREARRGGPPPPEPAPDAQ
ncbi:MAG TPA: hypothetical protein VMU43_02155 [Candidatus Acidoferrum sp.]|nr:hypothetical protein [Candidatus Acidoferrum sp.]